MPHCCREVFQLLLTENPEVVVDDSIVRSKSKVALVQLPLRLMHPTLISKQLSESQERIGVVWVKLQRTLQCPSCSSRIPSSVEIHMTESAKILSRGSGSGSSILTLSNECLH